MTFDEHDYDAVPRATFRWPGGHISVERFGFIAWSWFDSNPAMFATEVVEQSFDDFLATGIPPQLRSIAGGGDVVRQVREHLLGRKPGRSTHVVATVDTLSDDLMLMGWRLDGVPIHYADLDGPDYVSVLGLSGFHPLQMLVEPGVHRLAVTLHPRNLADVVFERELEIARGERVELVIPYRG